MDPYDLNFWESFEWVNRTMATDFCARGIEPTLQKNYETGAVTILNPPELAGRTVVAVDGWPCAMTTQDGLCGLIRGHKGDHWNCSHDLVEQEGPWAIVRDFTTRGED